MKKIDISDKLVNSTFVYFTSKKIIRKILLEYNFGQCFIFVLPFVGLLFGYDFSARFSIYLFEINSVNFIVGIQLLSQFILNSQKHFLFRKQMNLYVAVLPILFFLINMPLSFIAGEYLVRDNMININVNGYYLFIIFLPLLVTLVFLEYHLFIKKLQQEFY